MINLYTTSTIGNYKTGTVTCTKNSPTVTGTGMLFFADDLGLTF